MSVRLSAGDAVLVYINNDNGNNKNEADSLDNIQIGVIQYIGYIRGLEMAEYVGIELVEPINIGHKGTINGYQYFDCPEGHGVHTKITNVIRKLKASEVTIKMQEIITLFKTRLDEYVQALSERDEYIEKLKNKQRYLRRLLKESQPSNNHISSSLTSITQKLGGNILFKPDPICIDNQMKANDVDKNMQYPNKILLNETSNTSYCPTYRVVSPITPITPTQSLFSVSKPILAGSVKYNNSNTTASNTIIFHNIDKKTCTLKVNNATHSNKSIPSFQPTKLIPTNSMENPSKSDDASISQIEDKLDTFPEAEIMETYHVDNKKHADEHIDDTLNLFPDIETIKPSPDMSQGQSLYVIHSEYTKYSDINSKRANTSTSDEPSTKTECSDNVEDADDAQDSNDEDDEGENELRNGYDDDDDSCFADINVYSPYSSRRASKASQYNKIPSPSHKILTLEPIETPPLPPLHRSTSEYIPPNPPTTQQYAYSHMTHEQIQKHRNNMGSTKHIGIPSHQSLGVPILRMSYSNPEPITISTLQNQNIIGSKKHDHYNGQNQIKFVKSAPDLMADSVGYQKQSASWNIIGGGDDGYMPNHQYVQQQNLWIPMENINDQQIIYSVPNNNGYLAVHSNNNNPYYHQPQIDRWMQQQSHVQQQQQQNKYY